MTLSPGVWLVDEVINFYMSLLNDIHWKNPNYIGNGRRPYALKSYFITLLCANGVYNFSRVQSWSFPLFNFSAYSCILCPLNINNVHWALMYADFEMHTIYYLDSMLGTDATRWMMCFRQYLIDIHVMLYGTDNIPQWSLECLQNCAQQPNSYDCGVYICMFAYCIMTGQSIPRNFTNLYTARRVIAESIKNSQVLNLTNTNV